MKYQHDIKLAGNLKRILAHKKITVSIAAKKVGMNKSTLHGYCNGVVPRNLLKIRDLADLLEVSFAELIFGGDNNPSSADRHEELHEDRFEVCVRRLPPSARRQK